MRAQIWGPYMFRAGTGPDEARAGPDGPVTVYSQALPVGEELPFVLDPTLPPSWSAWSPADWRRQRGNVIRLALDAHHDEHGSWTLPCEIDVGSGEKPVTVAVPEV